MFLLRVGSRFQPSIHVERGPSVARKLARIRQPIIRAAGRSFKTGAIVEFRMVGISDRRAYEDQRRPRRMELPRAFAWSARAGSKRSRIKSWSTGLPTQSACRALSLPQTGSKVLSLTLLVAADEVIE